MHDLKHSMRNQKLSHLCVTKNYRAMSLDIFSNSYSHKSLRHDMPYQLNAQSDTCLIPKITIRELVVKPSMGGTVAFFYIYLVAYGLATTTLRNQLSCLNKCHLYLYQNISPPPSTNNRSTILLLPYATILQYLQLTRWNTFMDHINSSAKRNYGQVTILYCKESQSHTQ